MESIRQKLASGTLPREWDRTRMVPGGLVGPCAGCDSPTTPDNVAVRCETGGVAVVLHPDCYVIWEELCAESSDRHGA